MLNIENNHTFVFSADTIPAARCDDGETICFHTLDCFSGAIKTEKDLATGGLDHTNPATGPLYINGAEPGDALAVEIIDIRVADSGVCCTMGGVGVMWRNSELRTKVIPIKDGRAVFNDTSWDITPMVGVIGTAPVSGSISTGDSFHCGGNMDNPLIGIGAMVYLPVEVPGALLSMGDIHASMGEGEACGTGIEIAGEITVRVRLIKGFKLCWPVLETADAWYVNTNGRTADEAIERGYLELQRLVANACDWDLTDANMYISLQGLLAANQACLGHHDEDISGPTFRVGCRKTFGDRKLIG